MKHMEMLGQRIAIARKEKGMTQEKCAEVIGVSKATLIEYECGVLIPQESICKKISKALDIECSYSEFQRASYKDISEGENGCGDKLQKLSPMMVVRWKTETTDQPQLEASKRLLATANDCEEVE